MLASYWFICLWYVMMYIWCRGLQKDLQRMLYRLQLEEGKIYIETYYIILREVLLVEGGVLVRVPGQIIIMILLWLLSIWTKCRMGLWVHKSCLIEVTLTHFNLKILEIFSCIACVYLTYAKRIMSNTYKIYFLYIKVVSFFSIFFFV